GSAHGGGPVRVFSRRRPGCRRTRGGAHLRSRQPDLAVWRIVMRTPRRPLISAPIAVVTGFVVSAAVGLASPPAQDAPGNTAARPGAATWITAWGTSQQALADVAITNATVRMIARVTIPGENIRIRLDNTFGTAAVRIGRAYVGYRVQGAALAAGSNRPVTFSGTPEATIPAGGSTWSDPVRLPVLAQQDLAVSLYIPGSGVRPSQHTGAVATSYRIADGTCSTLDAHDRWEDVLSVRLGLEHDANARRASGPGPGLKAVVNEGIGGNTITREGLTPPADSTPGQ